MSIEVSPKHDPARRSLRQSPNYTAFVEEKLHTSPSVPMLAFSALALMYGCTGAETGDSSGAGGTTVVAASATGGGSADATSGNDSTSNTTVTGNTSDGEKTYQCGLPAPGSTGVVKPAGTAGNLKVLNWAGFKGAVTYTFDDANSSQISNYSALNALGVGMTFYIQTGKSDASNPIWAQAVKDGHELGNHSKSHAQAGAEADVDAATTFLQSTFGVKAWTMAAPYGDESYAKLAETRFLINRGVNNGLIAPNGNTNAFSVPCYIPATGAVASAFNAQVDAARSDGSWKVVLVHGFSGGSDSAYQPVSISEFTSSVTYAKELGDMLIDTMVDVGAYWRGQKVVSAVTPTTSGSDQVWSWTLPANFPTGKCLRVTVDGGTVKQNGIVLAWDTHGYYEISLDAGSVTVSP